MKHGCKLTVKMKDFLRERGIKPEQYLQVKNLPNELHFVHIKTNKIRKFIREDGNWYESTENSKKCSKKEGRE